MTDSLIEQAIKHAHANHDTYLEGFMELLRIPSISTDPAYTEDIHRAAEWIVAALKRLGFERCAAMPTEGHPVVYGEWLKPDPATPTVLVYAHYDVQPPDPLGLWESPPFEPTLREGKLYARGIIDDKIGVYSNLKVFESILRTAGALPLNIKVFFEGEEEIGSPGMQPFVKANKELLAADLLLVCDGASAPDRPRNAYSLRGAVTAEVTVAGPEQDLHSGVGGGAVHNPIHVVSEIIASFHNKEGHIQIPGAYDGGISLTEEERARFDALEDDIITTYRESCGGFRLWGESGYNFVERTTARPSLDVNGIYGGYQGAGMKTIIPAQAGFKVSMRLAPGQDPNDIAQKLVDHVMSFASDTVDVEVAVGMKFWPTLLLYDSLEINALNRAYKAVWGKEPLKIRAGASLPILGMFQQELEMPMTCLPLGTGGHGHAPNEYIFVDYFQTNIDTAIHFYYYLAEAYSKEKG
ncbi:MAG: dipeptidase [Candidatus Heimdallarchaeota archaeon]